MKSSPTPLQNHFVSLWILAIDRGSFKIGFLQPVNSIYSSRVTVPAMKLMLIKRQGSYIGTVILCAECVPMLIINTMSIPYVHVHLIQDISEVECSDG